MIARLSPGGHLGGSRGADRGAWHRHGVGGPDRMGGTGRGLFGIHPPAGVLRWARSRRMSDTSRRPPAWPDSSRACWRCARQLPPTLHFDQPNRHLQLETSAFWINDRLRPWPAPFAKRPRRAGVSAFGFGGTNVHLLLREPPLPPPGDCLQRSDSRTYHALCTEF